MAAKKYVEQKTLNEAVDAILTGMDKMFQDMKEHMDGKFTKLENEIYHNRRDIKEMKDDTPTRREFESLQRKVKQKFN